MGLFDTAAWTGKGMVRSKGKNGTIHYYAKPKGDTRSNKSSHKSSSSYHYLVDENNRRGAVRHEDLHSVTSYHVSDYSDPRGRHTQDRHTQKLEQALKDAHRHCLQSQGDNERLKAELGAAQERLDNSQAQLQAVQEQLRWANQRYHDDTLRWQYEKQHQEHENSALRQEVLTLKNKVYELEAYGRGRGRARSAERRSQPVYYSSPPITRSPSPPRDPSYYQPRVVTTSYRDPKGSWFPTAHFPPSPPASEFGEFL